VVVGTPLPLSRVRLFCSHFHNVQDRAMEILASAAG
jgi:hypothetical protein